MQLGLVIDLTNTNRYYQVSDWTEAGIGYVKVKVARYYCAIISFRWTASMQSALNKVITSHIFQIRCQGRDAVPDNDSVDKFIHEAS